MTQPSVRTIARHQDIDLAQLVTILRHRRPAGSDTEQQFVEEFLDVIPGMEKDGFGNRYIRVGTAPILWSCHTDTVSAEGGMQNVKWDGDILSLNQGKPGQSLGADDGAGMWLMLEMLKAGKEGLYVFHREEEVGGRGSRFISTQTPELLDRIDYAIAFDRRDLHSVITYQRGYRCCSDAFADALAEALNFFDGMSFKRDEGGVFTDTANYTGQIPECTNLSVGYYDEHTDDERLDVAHVLRLRECLLAIDMTQMPVERDPSKTESRWGGCGYGNWWEDYRSSGKSKKAKSDLDQMTDAIEENIYSTARWLMNMGLTPDTFQEIVRKSWKISANNNSARDHDQKVAGYLANQGVLDLEDEVTTAEMLWCNSCGDWSESHYADVQEGDACTMCLSNDTDVVEVDVNVETGEVVS